MLAGEERMRLRPLYEVDNGGPRVTTKGWAIGRFFLAAVAAARAHAVVAPLRILDRSSRSTRGARSAWLERPQRRERRGADERRRTEELAQWHRRRLCNGSHRLCCSAAGRRLLPLLPGRHVWEIGEEPLTLVYYSGSPRKKPNFRLSQANAAHYVNGPLNGPNGAQKRFKPVPFIPNLPFRHSVDCLDRSTV
jgi:hypothetical protein